MKNYEIKYRNLFYKKDDPTVKVFDVLILMNGVYETLQVQVHYEKGVDEHPWSIIGNDKFSKLTASEIDDFIDKMKVSERYFMSDDNEYEIIDILITGDRKNKSLIIAVAHDGGHFSTVKLPYINGELPEDFNLFIDTDWKYLDSKDKILEFIDNVIQFVQNN